MSEFTAKFVGTGGTTPTPKRGLPSTLVTYEDQRFLVDAGEGTQRQLLAQGVAGHIDAILLTHQHADHWLGVPGLLKTWALQDRESPVLLAGPHRTLVNVRRAMEILGDKLPFYVDYRDITEDHGFVSVSDNLNVLWYKTDHTVPSVGYAFQEADRPGRFDPEKARDLGVAEGPAWGRLANGIMVHGSGGREVYPDQVVGPERPGRKLVISGDTTVTNDTFAGATNADLLIHDGSFLLEDRKRANKTKHAVVYDVVALAREVNVKRLALIHTGARYTTGDVLAEAKLSAPQVNVDVPRDGDLIDIPVAK